MNPTNRHRALVVLQLPFIALMACGGDSSGDDRDGGGGDAGSASDGGPRADGGPAPGDAIVYAHDNSLLLAMDPLTFEVRIIGPMTGCVSVVDIAVNGNNELFGSGSMSDGSQGIIAIDPNTGACSLHVAGGFSNALSFVPAGVLHPDKEMLVSYGIVEGIYEYVSIDPDSGAVVGIGAPPNGYTSSGDIVSVEGGGTYWTAGGPCGGIGDCLVELNPATGAMIKDWGPLGYSGVWGLAYWGGVVYGFTANGEIIKVTFTGDVMAVELIADAIYSFFGAGSSTKAPIIVD